MALLSGGADRYVARYCGLNDGLLWAVEEIKSPCNDRGFGGISSPVANSQCLH